MPTCLVLPIVEVTILEDRAHVVRSGPVELGPGLSTLRLDELAPVLVDKSVVARLEGTEAEVLDARIERRRHHLADDLGTDWRELDALRHAAERKLASAKQALARLDAELADLGSIEELLLTELSQDLGYARFDGEKARADARRLRERAQGAVASRPELVEAVVKAEREASDLAKRRAAAGHRESKEVASITLTLRSAEAGSRVLRVEYVVPGAAWRPRHVASMKGGTLELRSEACVWQRTGEDWPAAMLRFSTERPSLGATPPTLETERLSTRPREQRIVVEAREQVVEDAGLGRAKVVEGLPGIDAGGEPLDLRSAEPMTVLSDGMPHRVPLFSFRSEAVLERVLVGERVAQVLVRSEHDHTGKQPILAGPVDLLRESGIVGRTTVLYVAPGERFELGFGPDPDLRAHRELATKVVPKGLVSSWNKVEHVVTLKLSNLGPERAVVNVRERIPVSEIDKVKVALDRERCEPRTITADANGMVRFPLELEPYGQAQAKLVYVVEKHDDVIG